MHEMSSVVLFYVVEYRALAYAVIFLLLLFESQTVVFAAAYLARQHYFDVVDLLLVIGSGMLVSDIVWYAAGRRFSQTSRLFRVWTEDLGGPLAVHLEKRTGRTLTIAKFVYGLHGAILLQAGALKISFMKFLRSDILAAAFWLTIIFGLGYGAGASLSLFRHYLKYGEIGLAIGLILFIVISRRVSRTLKKEL